MRVIAAALLHDIADGEPIEHARARELADAVLGSELVAKAEAVRSAEPRFLLRAAVELAALVLQEGR